MFSTRDIVALVSFGVIVMTTSLMSGVDNAVSLLSDLFSRDTARVVIYANCAIALLAVVVFMAAVWPVLMPLLLQPGRTERQRTRGVNDMK